MTNYLEYYASKLLKFNNGVITVDKDKGIDVRKESGVILYLTDEEVERINEKLNK